MKKPAVLMGVATALVGIGGVLFSGHHVYTAYVSWAIALCLFIIAWFMATHEERPRPLIVPIRYGRFDDGIRQINGRWVKANGTLFSGEDVLLGKHVGKYGLLVKNDGEAAYDVTVSEPHLGRSRLRFEADKARLTREDGEEFFGAWIELGAEEHSVNTTVLGSGLFEEMRQQKLREVEVTLTYKDADNRWYKTTGIIQRDASADGGLTVRYVKQERSKARKATSAD
jgi:hypothetical protein